jgi:hypothetical protein
MNARRKLLASQFESFFEHAVLAVADGQTLDQLIQRDPRDFRPAQFMRWVLNDPIRKQRYYDALETQAELMLHQLTGIADATDNPLEDTQRSALRIKTRQWQMGVANRKRFGDVKQLDVTSTVIDREALKTMTTEDIRRMALSGEYSTVRDDNIDDVADLNADTPAADQEEAA